MESARNGRRLLANPELRDDVAFCLRRDTLSLVAEMTQEGVVQLIQRQRTADIPARSNEQ
jgi:phosphosulfolactate phosphohydrolase-like enzyme